MISYILTHIDMLEDNFLIVNTKYIPIHIYDDLMRKMELQYNAYVKLELCKSMKQLLYFGSRHSSMLITG